MRDILVTVIVFGVLPFVFLRPQIGILLWSWIGYMVPHRLAFGFAYTFPYAAIVGGVTILACFVSRKRLTFFWSPVMGWLIVFNIWMLITTLLSLQVEESLVQWQKVIKIQFIVFLTMFILGGRKDIHNLVWVIALSFGFYGVKGGIFTILGGGESHVLGPPGGFFAGNTEIGLALVMVLPLLWYLFLNTPQKWIRAGLVIVLLLTPVAILGTQSRGALLAVVAIALFLWLKSRKKFAPFVVMLILIPVLYTFMPQQWHDRMNTIGAEEIDSSALGRIQAWTFSYKMAVARPIGGGFESFNAVNYEFFAPGLVAAGTGKYHDVHSIYFEILGEHGFFGLAIFIILGFCYWRTASKIMRLTRQSNTDKWAYDLASMLQVSLIGYAVGGAFLGVAYADLSYHFLAILVVLNRIVEHSSVDRQPNSLNKKTVADNTANNNIPNAQA